MIIKLLEQPIISIKEALIAGHVRGLVLEEDKVSGIYALADNISFCISVDGSTVGADAIMIAEVSDAKMVIHPANVLDAMTEVFNHQGVHMGSLIAVEVDDDFKVANIYTERCEFPYSKVTKLGDVILADVAEYEVHITENIEEEAEKLRSEVAASIDYDVVKNYKTIEPVINQNIDEDASNVGFESSRAEDANTENVQKDAVNELKATLRSVQEFSRHEEPASINTGKNAEGAVDKKYQYLCGKKLLEDIEINGRSFEKGAAIDGDLIKCAIESNAIVKVIMNAED